MAKKYLLLVIFHHEWHWSKSSRRNLAKLQMNLNWLFSMRQFITFSGKQHGNCSSNTSSYKRTFHFVVVVWWNHRPVHTCLEDLVANREARPVCLIVGDKLDEELAAAGDDRRRCDLPAKLPQHGWKLISAVVNLHVVVPVGEERRYRFRFTLLSKKNTLLYELIIDFYIDLSQCPCLLECTKLLNICMSTCSRLSKVE